MIDYQEVIFFALENQKIKIALTHYKHKESYELIIYNFINKKYLPV